jgi:2-polyprenyl-6-methoxyphenol hydroxylase-like FAD-dependent oxidoreductase
MTAMIAKTMTTSQNPILIVGAGMSGLLAALLVKKRRPGADVIVVERAAAAGGDYQGLDLAGFGHCDRAMRVIYETGFPEFDSLLHGLLPENEWHILPGNRKDVVGLYWRGALQTNCQYIDLRRLPAAERDRCEREILERAARRRSTAIAEDAASHLAARLGPLAGRHLGRALQKLYGASADALHASATFHPAMNRVLLYDEERMRPLLANEALRAVIAWPDQLTFPLSRQPAQAGLYPRRFGMSGVIAAAVAQLRDRGVRFLFNRRVVSMSLDGTAVRAATLDNGMVIDAPALVIGANGLHASLALLRGEPGPPPTGPQPPRHWMVFFRTPVPPRMGHVYHFFCYDERYRTFRVTNYAGYCPAARTPAGYPVCVELWSEEPGATQAIARARHELLDMNVLDPGTITAEGAIPVPNVHALTSLEGVRRLRAVRQEVRERSPENMITVGPFMADGVMLLFEVWRQMYPLLAERVPAKAGRPPRSPELQSGAAELAPAGLTCARS